MSLGPTPSRGLPSLPRPGPGPIPWPDPVVGPGIPTRIGFALAIAAGIILALAVRSGRRWARARRARAAIPTMPPPGAGAAELAHAARAALVAILGESWAARTTEEIVESEAALHAAFGEKQTTQLLAFLREADTARFADRDKPADAWRPAVAGILDTARSLRSFPGYR